MNKLSEFLIKNREYSIVIIRVSLALVILWFGVNQIINPENWFSYIPLGITENLPLSLETIIMLNGIFEIMIGILLLIGFYTRIIALIAALHLLSITIAVGFNEIGVRDFGLTFMAVSLIFSGAGVYSLDNKNGKIKIL